jgi:hypothetical protein
MATLPSPYLNPLPCDRIAETTDTLDLDFDRVAVSYRLRFARCTSKNYVSGHQRDELRNVAEQFVGRIDQFARRRILPEITIDPGT